MKLLRIKEIPQQGVSHNTRIRKHVIVGQGEIGTLVNYARAHFPPGELAPAHRHEDLVEIFTVESGCGEIRINEVAYVFEAGMTVVVEPGEWHELANTGTKELVVTYFAIAVG